MDDASSAATNWVFELSTTEDRGCQVVCKSANEGRMGGAEAETGEVPAAPSEEVALLPAPAETVKDVAEEKAVIPSEEKPEDSKALVVVEKTADPPAAVKTGGSLDRDAVLTRVETEKKLSLIKAWEENEKSKAENKAQKNLSNITSWENTKKADLEAQLKKIEESLEKKKAQYAETMKNRVATIHKVAEEKRAMIEAQKGEELLKAEEMAAKYRIKGLVPKKILGCFGS